MRRLVTIERLAAPLSAAAALAAPGAATATGAATPVERAQEHAPLQARLVSCVAGTTTATRTATFTASMPAISGTTRMWIRFDLLQRAPGDDDYTIVRVPAWGRWERSRPDRTAFIYTKKVRGLRPGSYRARVRFRWYADDRLQRTTQRTTRTCRQPDRRPNLTAGALTATEGIGPGTATYLLDVTNDGRDAAAAFDVGLEVGGAQQPPAHVDGLAAGESRVVSIAGPRCAPGTTVRFVLDPGGAVDESDEGDDVADRACPFTG
jgi:CARDB protein